MVSERVGVAFHGVADGKNPDVLSVGEGPGIATNIGVALFDDEGNLVPINRPPANWKRLYSGSTSLNIVLPGVGLLAASPMPRPGSL